MSHFVQTLLDLLREPSNTMEPQIIKMSMIGVMGLAILTAFVVRRRAGKKKIGDDADKDTRYVPLTVIERMYLSLGVTPDPISTGTWFRGDIHKASESIRQRMEQIVRVNPWVGGRFVKNEENGQYQIQYSVNEKSIVESVARTLQVTLDESIEKDLPYDEFAKKSQKYFLESKQDLRQPFWKIVLVPCDGEPDCFIMFMSMSHAFGDGYTKYALYNMLVGADNNEEITRLRVERNLSTLEQQEKVMGKDEAQVMGTIGIVLWAIRCKLLSWIGTRFNQKKLKVYSTSLLIDNDKVASIKMEEESKRASNSGGSDLVPQFISTNDIVTSWFLGNCGCDHGLMATNLRGRVDGHEGDMAGNYSNFVYYRCPLDVETPALIRQSLLYGLKRAVTQNLRISSRETAFQSCAIITNWATFCCQKVELTGCQMLKHAPICFFSESIGPTAAACIIFRAAPGRVGLLLAGLEDKLSSLVSGGGAPFKSDTESPFKHHFTG